MELTYKIKENGYEVYLNGILWITQYEPYIPNPSLSYEDNVKAQIIELTRTETSKTELELLQEKVELQEQSILELSMMVSGGAV